MFIDNEMDSKWITFSFFHSTNTGKGGTTMNSTFNYSGFVDMFLNSGDDYEPYGVGVPITAVNTPALQTQQFEATEPDHGHQIGALALKKLRSPG